MKHYALLIVTLVLLSEYLHPSVSFAADSANKDTKMEKTVEVSTLPSPSPSPVVISLPVGIGGNPVASVSAQTALESPKTPEPVVTIPPIVRETQTPTAETSPVIFQPLIIASPTPTANTEVHAKIQSSPRVAMLIQSPEPSPAKLNVIKTIKAPKASITDQLVGPIYTKSGFSQPISALLYLLSLLFFVAGIALVRPTLISDFLIRNRTKRTGYVQQLP